MSDKNGGTFELDEDMSDFLLDKDSSSTENYSHNTGKFEMI